MLYKTHKATGTVFMVAGFELLKHNGMLNPDMNDLIQLAIMFPVCSWASVAPDLDLPWENVRERTELNFVIHKALHLTRPQHRSWQTHCLLLNLLVCAFLGSLAYVITGVDGTGLTMQVVTLLIYGLVFGLLSHMFADSLTTGGIHLVPGIKVRLVPRWSCFVTGSTWEGIVRWGMQGLLVIYLIKQIVKIF